MDKRFKLRFSLFSFQFCRPKHPSSFPKSPLPPSTLLFSPRNPKSFDISFPSFKYPNPPPSTPNQHSFNLQSSPTPHIESPASGGSDGQTWPSKDASSKNESETNQKKKEENHEDLDYSLKKPIKLRSRRKHNKTNVLQKTRSSGSVSPASKPIVRRQAPLAMVEGKATESFAVVKRSEDPYEDFKRSMLEMILEKQTFEADDLEQLLLCFLSLNSREYHGVIVEAFSEIWELLFHKSP
ncbi:transcription repressor OFP7-like [Cornus florida]|uniref:transcription repressor OFP7-like n=1 Tax=Cornus florida TaxID=4283 RepID=UPI00289C64DB|nr:transcription repressor OFP7-like [Cornus florida]